MTTGADDGLLRLEALLAELAFHRNAMSAGEIKRVRDGQVV